jgi:hypothetical protein
MRSFTKDPPYVLELEGLKVDNRNETVGLSLAHLRRVLLQSYFGGANFFYPGDGPGIYNEDGSLNPMGWPYDEVARLAARHPDRGVPYTPVAVLLDRAHGWEKYTYAGQRIWDTKPLAPADRMIDAFFNIAVYPFPRNEGEPANDLNVPFPHGVFGDIFDVLVTSPTHMDAIDAYPVLICVGDTRLDAVWGERLKRYVERGGTLVINAKQVTPESGLDPAFLGAGQARCPDREANGVVTDAGEELWSTPFGYACWMANGATVIARTPDGNAIAFLHEVGRGRVVLTTPRYLLGLDGQPLPYFAHLLRRLTDGLMPVEVRGDVQHSINLRDDGYVILLSNNAGITKLSHSPAVMDASQTRAITLRVREKPLATEEWIGEEPRDWAYPNEWMREYTQPIEVTWKPHGDIYVAELTLQPGEIRAVFLRMR